MTVENEYSNLWRRLLAISGDIMLLSVLSVFSSDSATFAATPGEVLETVLLIAFFAGYRVVMHVLLGQTVGKRIAGIRVVRADGAALTFKQALARETLFLLFAVAPVVGYVGSGASTFGPRLMVGLAVLNFIVDPLVAVFHPHRRALHDIIAGTLVLRAQRA